MGTRWIQIGRQRCQVETGTSNDDFWDRFESKTWEPHTVPILETFLTRDTAYLDVGAWIGPTVLAGAALSRHCYAFEPDPTAFRALSKHVALNSHVAERCTLYQQCIAIRSGKVSLGNRSVSQGGDSMSSLLVTDGPGSWEVDATTLGEVIAREQIHDCGFIKMDIEGGEIEVLPNIANLLRVLKPTLYLSLHPEYFPNPQSDMQGIADALSNYPYLYSITMQPISLDQLMHQDSLEGFFEVVATDRGPRSLENSPWADFARTWQSQPIERVRAKAVASLQDGMRQLERAHQKAMQSGNRSGQREVAATIHRLSQSTSQLHSTVLHDVVQADEDIAAALQSWRRHPPNIS